MILKMGTISTAITLIALLSSSTTIMAQSCIPLMGSTMCPAFNASSVSNDASNVGPFTFLTAVTNVTSFDEQLANYVNTTYPQTKYQDLLGCSAFDSSNTTDLYARYTISTLCSAIVQNSVHACSLTGVAASSLCADSCADFALSEQAITASSQLCGIPGNNAQSLIRADFTDCALPAQSLQETCIPASSNEPDNCGFADNLSGLCGYCAASSPNATDSCCLFANTGSRCKNVHLPITSAVPPLFTSASPTASATAAPTTHLNHAGLSGGAIAGIVVGSILGALILIALVIGCCLLFRRRAQRRARTFLNQPSPPRTGEPRSMVQTDGAQDQARITFVPGGRVARMTALEGGRQQEEQHAATSSTAAQLPKRSASLSSESAFASVGTGPNETPTEESSPRSGTENYSSPGGPSSGQSEQLAFFKDYYSQDEIHPGDRVSVLWAYQPRANDEFELDRGDMLKVVGIWDDGWATGVRVAERADEWDDDRDTARDSGMSHGAHNHPANSSPRGEIKAFPLVCVCVPRHWRRTIESDTIDHVSELPRLNQSSSP